MGGSRAGESVWETQPVVQNLGLEEQFEYGRRNRSAVGAACRSAKGTVLDLDFLKPRFRTTGSAEKKGKVVLGSSEWVQEKPTGGAGWAMGSNPFNLVGVGLVKSFKGPIGPKLKRPIPQCSFLGGYFPLGLPQRL